VPLCLWPQHAQLAQQLTEKAGQTVAALPAASRNALWLQSALAQDGINDLHATSVCCMQASLDVGGYLDTLQQVHHLSRPLVHGSNRDTHDVQTGSMTGIQTGMQIGMQCLAPVPGDVYTHAAAGAHHRVLLRCSGQVLPAAARINDVCAGLAAGRPCTLMMLNDVLVVSLNAPPAPAVSSPSSCHAAFSDLGGGVVHALGGGWQTMAKAGWDSEACGEMEIGISSTIFYLAETLIVRIRGLAQKPYTIVVRTQDDCAPQLVFPSLSSPPFQHSCERKANQLVVSMFRAIHHMLDKLTGRAFFLC